MADSALRAGLGYFGANHEAGCACGTACALCGNVVAAETLRYAPALGGAACEGCRSIAERVVRQFRTDALRAWGEVRGQLPQMVKDVRAGSDVPTFYRGFE